MKICPNNHTLPNGENFPDMFVACPICAATLVEELQNIQLVCKNCGLSLEIDWNICPACGTSVNEKASKPLDNESEIPSDILQLLERRHKLTLHTLNSDESETFEERQKIEAELQKNKLEYYIELDAKSPNAELESYIGDHCENEKEQYRWWIKSADNGRVQSYNEAYIAYENGIGRKQNHKKAWNYLEKGVNAGVSICIKNMACELYNKAMDNDELEKLTELVEKLKNAKKDCWRSDGYLIAGQIAEDNSEYARAFDMYKNAFKLEDNYAGLKLALMYKTGTGVEANSKKAVNIMKKIAKDSNEFSAEAYWHLGNWYNGGNSGCEKNLEKAFEYYKTAAEKGFSYAQNTLGIFYDNGEYVKQDSKKAVYWYKKALASDENNLAAKCNLGLSYYSGNGVDIDENYGLQLIQEAADAGCEEAQDWLKKYKK